MSVVNLFRSIPRRFQVRCQVKSTYHPRLETLEDRTLLSVVTVDRLTDNNPPGGGGEGGNGMGDLRWCIVESLFRADTINFSVTGTINLTSALPTFTRSVSIVGPGANLMTVRRDTGGFYGIFTVATGAMVGISGLTISNGIASVPSGGGIRNSGTLTVTSCVISENSGAGIFNDGKLTVNNSTISSNSARDIDNRGIAAVSNCTISGNTANLGGGIYNGFASGSNSGILTVNNSTISGNKGNFGGGIDSLGITTVSNSTISGNGAYSGGGISSTRGTLTVTNSTIAGNSALVSGGGIYLSTNNLMHARNTIIAGNTGPAGPDVYGNVGSQGHNLIGNPQDATGFVDTDILHVNPLLGPLRDNGGPTFTMALLPGSPAIRRRGPHKRAGNRPARLSPRRQWENRYWFVSGSGSCRRSTHAKCPVEHHGGRPFQRQRHCPR
jgi:hypothetical protein